MWASTSAPSPGLRFADISRGSAAQNGLRERLRGMSSAMVLLRAVSFGGTRAHVLHCVAPPYTHGEQLQQCCRVHVALESDGEEETNILCNVCSVRAVQHFARTWRRHARRRAQVSAWSELGASPRELLPRAMRCLRAVTSSDPGGRGRVNSRVELLRWQPEAAYRLAIWRARARPVASFWLL